MSPLEKDLKVPPSPSGGGSSPIPFSPRTLSRRAVGTNIAALQAKLVAASLGDEPNSDSNHSSSPTTSLHKQHQSCIKGQSNSLNNNKNARFGPTASSEPKLVIKTIQHFTELDPEMREAVWFTSDEVARIVEEATQTVIAMNDGVPLADDDVQFTTRGLEYMTPKGFDITTSSLDIVQLVLEEQQRQRSEPGFKGKLDDDLIAATVGGVSRHRSRIAHLAAMKDARGVYGDGNFKVDPQVSSPRPCRSRSFDGKREPRRGMLSKTGSMGAAAEKTRRRRGSRGPLPRHTRQSAPDAVHSGPSIEVPEKTKSCIL